MNPAIASVIFSAIALLITVFGTLRMSRKAAVMQEWNYRQKIGEELGALSSLLTQNQLLTQRELQRTGLVEREAKLLIDSPADPAIISFLQDAMVSRATAEEKVETQTMLRKQLDQLWQLDHPSPNQLATVQTLKASTQKELLQLQDLHPTSEERYRNFMASAAKVA